MTRDGLNLSKTDLPTLGRFPSGDSGLLSFQLNFVERMFQVLSLGLRGLATSTHLGALCFLFPETTSLAGGSAELNWAWLDSFMYLQSRSSVRLIHVSAVR